MIAEICVQVVWLDMRYEMCENAGLIINRAMLLKWNSTHNINSVTALQTRSSAYTSRLCSGSKAAAHLKAIAQILLNIL